MQLNIISTRYSRVCSFEIRLPKLGFEPSFLRFSTFIPFHLLSLFALSFSLVFIVFFNRIKIWSFWASSYWIPCYQDRSHFFGMLMFCVLMFLCALLRVSVIFLIMAYILFWVIRKTRIKYGMVVNIARVYLSRQKIVVNIGQQMMLIWMSIVCYYCQSWCRFDNSRYDCNTS